MIYPMGGWFNQRNVVGFAHKVTLGATGALSSQEAASDTGIVCSARVSAGRYTLTLPSKYRKFYGGVVSVIGPDTAVYGAKTKGLDYFFRADDVDANNKDGTVELQFVNPSTDATNYIDSDLPDNTSFLVVLFAAF